MQVGWHQLGFEKDLGEGLSRIESQHPLISLRTRKGVRVFDAICPHRGAHLGFGGRADGDAVVCPFHARRVGLGVDCGSGFSVKEHPAFSIGGMVFACASERHDHGFRERMQAIDRDHYFLPGFTLRVPAPAVLVIENGLDNAHFRPVHAIRNDPTFEILPSEHGEFALRGEFMVPSSPWQQTSSEHGLVLVPYLARAFGPGVMLSHMGGVDSYWVITAATPLSPRECVVRLSVAIPAGPGGAAPSQERCSYLLRQAQVGLEKDLVIWEHLSHDTPPRFTAEDASVIAFRRYLRQLEEAAS